MISQGLDGHYHDVGNMPENVLKRGKIKEWCHETKFRMKTLTRLLAI